MAHDSRGNPLSIGSIATLTHVRDELLANLQPDDQLAILAAVGRQGSVSDLLHDGTVEFEIQESDGFRYLFIPGSCLLL